MKHISLVKTLQELYYEKSLDIRSLDFSLFDVNDTNDKKHNALMYLMSERIDFKMQPHQLDYLFKHTNLMQLDEYNQNLLYFILSIKSVHHNPDSEQLMWVLKHSDINQISYYEQNALMTACDNINIVNLNFTEEHFDYLVYNSNLLLQDKDGYNSLMAFVMNFSPPMTDEQLNYLIINSNLKQTNKDNENILHFITNLNKTKNLNITQKQWNYMINNCNLNIIPKTNCHTLCYFLENYEKEALNLNTNHWEMLTKNQLTDKNDKAFKNILKYLQDELKLNGVNHLSRLWPYIVDKSQFIDYIEHNSEYENLLLSPEIKIEKEKNLMSGLIEAKKTENIKKHKI